MAYYNSENIRVFPSVNAIYSGKLLSEPNLLTPVTRLTDMNFVLGEHDFEVNAAGNDIELGVGKANINGYYIETKQSIVVSFTSDGIAGLALDYYQNSDVLKGDNSNLSTVDNPQVYEGVIAGCFTINTNGTYSMGGKTYLPKDVLAIADIEDGVVTRRDDCNLKMDSSNIRVDKHYPEEGYTSLKDYLAQMKDRYVPQYGSSSIKAMYDPANNDTYPPAAEEIVRFDTGNHSVEIYGENSAIKLKANQESKIELALNGDISTIEEKDNGLYLTNGNGEISITDSNIKVENPYADITMDNQILVNVKGGPTVTIREGIVGIQKCNLSVARKIIGKELSVATDGISFHKSVSNGVTTDYNTTLKLDTTDGETLVCNTNFKAAKVYNAVYNDYAELYKMEEGTDVEVGDVIALNPKTGLYEPCDKRGSKLVVGVCSDSYGHILGGDGNKTLDENLKEYIPVGIAGRVKVRVRGNVEAGDLLMSSFGGAAEKDRYGERGTIIGKALQSGCDEFITMQIMLG